MAGQLDTSIEEAISAMRGAGTRRIAFVTTGGVPSTTIGGLLGIPEALGRERDFAEHEAVFLEIGEESGALLGAFVHRTVRGQAPRAPPPHPHPPPPDYLPHRLPPA